MDGWMCVDGFVSFSCRVVSLFFVVGVQFLAVFLRARMDKIHSFLRSLIRSFIHSCGAVRSNFISFHRQLPVQYFSTILLSYRIVSCCVVLYCIVSYLLYNSCVLLSSNLFIYKISASKIVELEIMS